MPIPGTDIPLPWDQQPAVDTSGDGSQSLAGTPTTPAVPKSLPLGSEPAEVKATLALLAADHKGQPTIAPSAAMGKDANGDPTPTGMYLYTFPDGATAEIGIDGGLGKQTAATKTTAAATVTANTTDPNIVMRNPNDPTQVVTVPNPNYKPPAPTNVTANTTDPNIVTRDPSDPTKLITTPNPNYKQPQPTSVATNTTDQFLVTRDATTGATSTAPNPNYQAPAAAPISTNTTDQYIVMRDPKTGNTTTVANPNYNKPSAAPITANTTDQFIVMRDPTTGATSQVPNPNYQKPGATVVGSPSTTDQFVMTRDPTTGALSQQPNPNYVAPKPTALTPSTTAPYTQLEDPTGQITSQPNPNYLPTDPAHLTIQLNQQAQTMAAQLHQQVTAGSLTGDQAASQFDQWYTANVEPMKQQIGNLQASQQYALQSAQGAAETALQAPGLDLAKFAQTASNDAQSRLVSMLPYTVGANAGNVLQQAMQGGWKNLSPGALQNAATYSLPNLQEVGRLGAAQALANISPTAQMHLQNAGPPAQAPAQGLPDVNGLLNQSNYGFGPGGTPGGAPAGPQPMPNPAGAPAPAPQPMPQTAGMPTPMPQPMAGPTGNPATGPATAAPAAAPATPAIDWNALLARQQQDAALQQQQALVNNPTAPGQPGSYGPMIPSSIWGNYQPGGMA